MESSSSYTTLMDKLNRFIRKYHTNQLIRGLLITIAIVLSYFLLIALLEGQFYFAKGVRKVLFFSFLSLSLGSLAFLVFAPLLKLLKLGKHISNEEAAKIIGNHFPEVQDKLLNILQLNEEADTSGLVQASIQQKTQSIQLVPFSNAINLGENRKYLRYALPPLLLFLFFLWAAPSLIKPGTDRLIKNGQDFEREAPFHFVMDQERFEVVQYEDFELIVSTQGSVVPDQVFIVIDDLKYRMTGSSPGEFSYTFKNVQKEREFYIESGFVRSGVKKLDVLMKPVLSQLVASLDYPTYTGRKDEIIENTNDLLVPVGTEINWSFVALHTDNIGISGLEDQNELNQTGDQEFSFSSRVLRDTEFLLGLNSSKISLADTVSLDIRTIADEYPSIEAREFRDSNNLSDVFFAGKAADDYGLRGLSFNYTINKANGSSLPLVSSPVSMAKGKSASFQYQFSIDDLNLEAGDEVVYYFEVSDNDGVNGSKSTKSREYKFSRASREEIEQLTEANDQEIKSSLDKNQEKAMDLQDRIQEVREDLLQKKELDWKTKKELENLLKEQQQMNQELQDMQEKFQENLENQEETTPELKEKQEKLQELFDKNKSKELEELMNRVDELMKEMDKDEALEMLEDMSQDMQEDEFNMERTLEMYKKLEVELELTKEIQELEKLAEQQKELAKETEKLDQEEQDSEKDKEQNTDSKGDNNKEENSNEKNKEGEKDKTKEEIQKEQEEIKEKFEEIQEKLEEIKKKNEDLQSPHEIPDQSDQEKEIEQEQQESMENMQKNENQKASENQQNAGEKMQQMAQEMQQSMMQGQQDQMMEDMETLRQLLENLLTLSFEQEKLIYAFRNSQVNTPRYTNLTQSQKNIEDDFQVVEDTLMALSKRVFELETFITEKVAEIHTTLDKSLNELEERNKTNAGTQQQKTMTSLNDLALMLDESMQNMQQQMASGQPSAMCNNPKPGGKPGAKPGKVPQDKMSQGQQKLNEEMQQMMKDRQNGQNPGSSGDAKKFAEMAAEQAAMRKALEAQQKLLQEQGKGKSDNLEKILQDMDKTETDLVNKRLTNEMMKRQQEILTRMLEHEKAERQQDKDKKRESKAAAQLQPKFPPSLEEYLKERESEISKYRTVSPDLKLFYKNLVEQYYKELNE